MTPDLPTVLLAKSLDKRLTSHPVARDLFKYILFYFIFFRFEEIKSHFSLAWASKNSKILAEQQPNTEVNF